MTIRPYLFAAAGALAVVVAVPSPPASAVELTTATLADACRMEDKSFCYGFMTGAWQFYEALIAADEADIDAFVCHEGTVSHDEAVAVFLSWTDANASMLDEPGVNGLFRAWSAAYPCN